MTSYHPLAQVTLTDGEFALSVFGAVAVLIGYHFTARRYIRESAGIRETYSTEIANQPVTVRAAVEFVPTEKFEELERYVHDREQEILGEVMSLAHTIEARRQDASDQLDSLREKLDQKFSEAMKAGNVSASKIHERIEHMSSGLRAEIDSKVGQLHEKIGEMPNRIVDLLRGTGAIGQQTEKGPRP
jgi:Cu/Ag efflux pump CusA